MKRTIAAYTLAALAGLGLIYVPHEMFYDYPELWFMGLTKLS